MSVELCHGCFAAPRSAAKCEVCGYREGRRSSLVLPPGTILSRGGQYSQYVVGRVLGKPGGFGITYLGWHSGLEQRVAIKEFLPRDWAGRESGALTVTPHSDDDDELFRYGLEQFLQEARTLARINHPNVVRVRDFFEQNGTAYLVMDYYEGVSLSEYVAKRGGKLGEEEAVRLMLFVLDGLREVHRNGFLHRDIKPQNIYLRSNGQPILLDFGAARQAIGDRTRSMSVVLTAGFAPFEQYHRSGRQGPWTDIYACGATLYYLLTGDIPPEATERMESDALAPLAKKLRGASAEVVTAIERAIALRPEERPQSVEEFQALLGVEAAVSAGSAPREERDAGAAIRGDRGAEGVPPAAAPDLGATVPLARGGSQATTSSDDSSLHGTVTGAPPRRRGWVRTVSWSTVLLTIGLATRLGFTIWRERQQETARQEQVITPFPTRPTATPAARGDSLVPLVRTPNGGVTVSGGGTKAGAAGGASTGANTGAPAATGGTLVPIVRNRTGGQIGDGSGTGSATTGGAGGGTTGAPATSGRRADAQTIDYARKVVAAMTAGCEPSRLEHRFVGLVFVVERGADQAAWDKAMQQAKTVRSTMKPDQSFNALAPFYTELLATKVVAREYGPYRQGSAPGEVEGALKLHVGELSDPVRLDDGVAILRKEAERCVE